MHDHITITGTVGSDPEAKVSSSTNVPWTTFRFVTNQRRRTPDGTWEDVSSNWYSVTSFRGLGRNVASCVKKGDRLVVSGRLELAETGQDETRKVWPQIVATSIGHDLNFGIATVERRSRPADAVASGPATDSASPIAADPRTGEVSSEHEVGDPRAAELVGAGAGSALDVETPF